MPHNLKDYLVNITKSKYSLHLTTEQWALKGATVFKRKLMGYCGTKTTKSADEITDILTSMHSNHLSEETNRKLKQEITNIVSSLDNQKITYEWGNIYFKKLDVDTNNNSSIKYLITKC